MTDQIPVVVAGALGRMGAEVIKAVHTAGDCQLVGAIDTCPGREGEDVGLATVYRVLTQFEAAGLVVRHNFDGGHAVFELADGEHHDHMVCVDSGEVVEFFDPEIERRQREIVKEHGFELVDHNLVLYVRKAGGK